MCFLDDYTKFIWFFPLKQNPDIFLKYVERHFDIKIKVVQTNWGNEFCHLNNYFESCGIDHHIACSCTH